MADGENHIAFSITMNERRRSVAVFSLFFSWILAFPFEGKILYSFASSYQINPSQMVFGSVAATFAGLFLCGFLIRTMKSAKRLILCTIVYCFLVSCMFLFLPPVFWTVALISSALLAGGCVAAWGFFYRSGTPKHERIKTAADGLIYSNILMILLNLAAIHLSPKIGLVLAMGMLVAAFLIALRLPTQSASDVPNHTDESQNIVSIKKPLAFLCLFIVTITISSGLMYQVLNPAFAHLEWLASWYWAIPYIVALYIMRNLSPRTNRTYILYLAIAMIGFAFILFVILDQSAVSYLAINTLMLGACGVYDLFWWSILGEMLDLNKNPAKVLGIGLSANVLGVLLGGLAGNVIISSDTEKINSSILALTVVCITMAILPPLHKHLSLLLNNHAYLTVYIEMPSEEQEKVIDDAALSGKLTEREREIAALLVKGNTYRMIAGELCLSENTIKTHIKNIYSKFGIQSRSELMHMMFEGKNSTSQ